MSVPSAVTFILCKGPKLDVNTPNLAGREGVGPKTPHANGKLKANDSLSFQRAQFNPAKRFSNTNKHFPR